MCARRLRTVVSSESDQPVADISQAGQGAHREVGSEGFAVDHRAVAEQGEPVGQNPGENRAGTMAAKEILGAPGCIKVCAGGTVAQEHALPREVSYGPTPTGSGTWTYKPLGEVVGDAVREVGVTRGTQEPRNNTSLGTSSRTIPVCKRAVALGIADSGSSIGLALFVPLLQQLIPLLGWRAAYGVLAGLVLILLPLRVVFQRPPPNTPGPPNPQTPTPPASAALMSSTFALLFLGWFAAWFSTQSFVLHHVAYMTDKGSRPTQSQQF